VITEEENQKGRFCGACHDGKIAFGHTSEHCDKCHNGNISYGIEKFRDLRSLPPTPYGNKIDWVQAWKDGLIKPKNYLRERKEPIKFEKELTLEAAWFMIPPAIFSHKLHGKWLDCSNCHPEIFNIKKKATKHFSMIYILNNEFCGVCHGKVAFPIDNCKRCHPAMK
jgi:c(7)-type cytochrome triheme protein